MNAEDQKAVEDARENGAGVLHNVLTGEELDAVWREFDRAHLDLDLGPGEPGSRDSLRSELLLKYPALARGCSATPELSGWSRPSWRTPNPSSRR